MVISIRNAYTELNRAHVPICTSRRVHTVHSGLYNLIVYQYVQVVQYNVEWLVQLGTDMSFAFSMQSAKERENTVCN
jgi:hypothetical protein